MQIWNAFEEIFCLRSNLSNYDIIFVPWRLGLKTGVENDFFWSVLPHQEFPRVNPQGSPSLDPVL